MANTDSRKGVPDHVTIPDNLEFNSSKVDDGQTGVFCVWPIAKGTMFGPYEGRILGPKRANKTDPRYSWLVFKLDTMKLIHIVDSTDSKYCNWLRYVCCARYLEEQNILSTQGDDEIYYKAMRDIAPGEELLTWFHSRKCQRRSFERSASIESVPVAKQNIGSERKAPAKVQSLTRDRTCISSLNGPEREKRIRKPKIIPDAYEGPIHVRSSKAPNDHLFEPLLPGQKRRRRKKLSSDASDVTTPGSESLVSRSDSSDGGDKNIDKYNANNTDENNANNTDKNLAQKPDVKVKKEIISKAEQPSLNEINSSLPDWKFPLQGTEYVFEIELHHITTQSGRKVYKCDICYGLYKHMFSLKRHYLRNHINYKYLSKADLTNCLINLPQVIQSETNAKVAKDTSTVAGSFIKQEPGAVNDNDLQNGTVSFASRAIKQEIIDSEYDNANDTGTGEQNNKMEEKSEKVEWDMDTDLDESGKLVIDINDSHDKHSDDDSSIIGKHLNNSTTMDTPDKQNKDKTAIESCEKLTDNDTNTATTNGVDSMNEARRTGPIATSMTNLFRCYTCYEYFNRKEDICEHTQNHPLGTSGSMVFTCDKCSMRFPYKQNLVRHQAVHEVDKPSKVKVKKEGNLTPNRDTETATDRTGSGMKVKLRGQKQFMCEKCPMKFRHSKNLIKHMVLHRTDQSGSSFPCDFCGKDFPSLSNLKKHVRFHLEYRISCRYCPDFFSNVGALRKHIRLSHPDIYKAKQQDKLARDGVLRKPDKKTLPLEDEDTKCDTKSPSVSGKSSETTSDTEKSSKTRKKGSKSDERFKDSDDFLFDNADFAAEEIDDGGSRFKYSCTICKKRFSSYLNMCRHRRKAHESKPKIEETEPPVEVKKEPSPVRETPETTALFFANVSNNIATNLNNYIDGKQESLEKFADHINIEGYTSCFNTGEDQQVDFTWAWYNFPADYKPAQTVSFSDIRDRFNYHSEYKHCEAATTETVDSENKTVESVHYKDPCADNNVIETVDNCNIIKTENETEVNECVKSMDKDNSKIMKNNSVKIDGAKSMEAIVNPAVKSTLPFSHLRKKFPNFLQDNASPATKRFKRVIDGDYVNFDDLCDMLPSAVDSPLLERKGSTSVSLAVNDADMRDTDTHEVEIDDRTEALVKRLHTPMPLSLMCEHMLGLKRLEPHYWEIEHKLMKSVENLHSCRRNNDTLFSTLSLSSSPINGKSCLPRSNEMTKFHDHDIPDKTSVQNYDNIVFGKNGQVTNVCAICRKHYSDFDSLIRHHWRKHSASVCNYLQIEQGNEIENLHFSEPSPVGVLAVTDPGLDNAADRDSYYCTSCNMPFETVSRLHVHIVNCSAVAPVSGTEKAEQKGKSPTKTPMKKKIKKSIQNIFNGGQNLKFKLKDFAGYKNGGMPEEKPKKHLFSGNQVTPVRLINRRSQEALCYNPSKHIRRRELTTVNDSHNQCEACGLKFKSIILLERHVKNCSKKERFKDIHPMKCPIMEESLEKLKHICFYCNKNFTYMKSLVNHFQDFCPVKKMKLNKGQITEEEKQREEEIIDSLLSQEDEKVSEDTSPLGSNGKRKGWQKGVKRKSKRKGFSWTSMKKKKLSATEDTLEETTVIKTEDENKSDEEECSEIVNDVSTFDNDAAIGSPEVVTSKSGLWHDIDEVDSGMEIVSMSKTENVNGETEMKETQPPPVDAFHISSEKGIICSDNMLQTKESSSAHRQKQADTTEQTDLNCDNVQKANGELESLTCLKNTAMHTDTQRMTSGKDLKSTKSKKCKSKGSSLFQCISAMNGQADNSIVESKLEMDSPPLTLHHTCRDIPDIEVASVPKEIEGIAGQKLSYVGTIVVKTESLLEKDKGNKTVEDSSNMHNKIVESNRYDTSETTCDNAIPVVTSTALPTEKPDINTNDVAVPDKREIESSYSDVKTIKHNLLIEERDTLSKVVNKTENDVNTTENQNGTDTNDSIVSVNKEIEFTELSIVSDVSHQDDNQSDIQKDKSLIINNITPSTIASIDTTQSASNTKCQDITNNEKDNAELIDNPNVTQTKESNKETPDIPSLVLNDVIENTKLDTPTGGSKISSAEENSSNTRDITNNGRDHAEFIDNPTVVLRKDNDKETPDIPLLVINDDIENTKLDPPSVGSMISSAEENSSNTKHKENTPVSLKKRGRPRKKANSDETKSQSLSSPEKNLETADRIRHGSLEEMQTDASNGTGHHKNVFKTDIAMETNDGNGIFELPQKLQQIEVKPSSSMDTTVTAINRLNTLDEDNNMESVSNIATSKNVECHRKPFKSCNDIRLEVNKALCDNIEQPIIKNTKHCPSDTCIKQDDLNENISQKRVKENTDSSENVSKKQLSSENKDTVKLKVMDNMNKTTKTKKAKSVKEKTDSSENVSKKQLSSENKDTVKLKVMDNMSKTTKTKKAKSLNDNLEAKVLTNQDNKKLTSEQIIKDGGNVTENKILQKSPEPCEEEPFDYPLSPGEYVKINKRHCKQQFSYSYGRQNKAAFTVAKMLNSGSKISLSSVKKLEIKVQEDSAINTDNQIEASSGTLTDSTKMETNVRSSTNITSDTSVRRGRKRKSICLDELSMDDISVVPYDNSEHAAAVLALSNEVKRKRSLTCENKKNKLDKCKTAPLVVSKTAKTHNAGGKTNERNKVNKLCKFFSTLDQPEQDRDELFSKQTRRSKERLRQILDV